MTKPALPPNHELLPPDFLRQYGAVKGLRYHNPEGPSNTEWSYWLDYKILPRALRKFTFCAPVGSVAAATTPVPEGRCNCCEEECRRMEPDQPHGPHHPLCPAHLRNAYVHIPPYLLAQLPEKPEGLIWVTSEHALPRRSKKYHWTEPNPEAWAEIQKMDKDVGDFAYAVPRHVLDRIEQQLSKSSQAAPVSSDPTGEAAPSDTEMLDWLTKSGYSLCKDTGFSGACDVWSCFKTHPPKPYSTLSPVPMYDSPRSAILSAMKEDRK